MSSLKEPLAAQKNILQGSVLRYDRPTDPVDEDEL